MTRPSRNQPASTILRFAAGAVLAASVLFADAEFAGVAADASDDLFDRYFANVLDGRPCFARTYDDAHLAAHSAQRVKSIEIDLAKTNSDNSPNSADRFELGFALMLKTKHEWYGQAASCKTTDTAFDCFLEGDGGLLHLTPLPNGGLRLETGDTGIAIEGSTDVAELAGKSGDDKVFDLAPSKDECDSARAFFEGGSSD